jgi:hypothetical protein
MKRGVHHPEPAAAAGDRRRTAQKIAEKASVLANNSGED